MASPQISELRRQVRRKYLLTLKKKITYKGSNVYLQEAAVYWLARTCGYRVDGPFRRLIRHQNATAFGMRDADMTLGFRGLGKTTIGTIVRAIKYHLDNPNCRILIVSDTQGAAERILREIRTILQTNRDLIEMFGEFFGPSRYSDLGRYREHYATTLLRTDPTISEPSFVALGTGGQAASMHFEVVLADDIVTLGNSRTKTQRKIVDDWHGSTLLGCCIDGTRTHYLGTRYTPNDQYQVLEDGRIDEDGGVLRGAVLRIPALIPDGSGAMVSSYPERFSTEHFMRIRRRMGRYHFNAQMQQDTSSADGMVFRYSDFRWYGTGEADEAAPPRGLAIYQYTDLPAKRTDAGDFQAIVTIGLQTARTVSAMRIYVLDLVHERCGMGQMRKNMNEALHKWNPARHWIEAVGMQAGFAQEMQETMDPRYKESQVEADKFMRAQRVAPLVENNQVYFPMPETARGRAMSALLDELCSFPDGDNDDCVDAFVGAITEAVFRGRPAASSGSEDDEGDWDRDTGLRARY